MKLPWSKPEMKSGESWIALAGFEFPEASTHTLCTAV